MRSWFVMRLLGRWNWYLPRRLGWVPRRSQSVLLHGVSSDAAAPKEPTVLNEADDFFRWWSVHIFRGLRVSTLRPLHRRCRRLGPRGLGV
jgi:hypothetical protein